MDPAVLGWSSSTITQSRGNGKVLGPFSNDPVHLQIRTVVGTQYKFSFKLWVVDTWDGSFTTPGDIFRVQHNGVSLVEGTIGVGSRGPGTFPGFRETLADTLGGSMADTRITVSASFTATSTLTTLVFDAENLSDISDESWAIDDFHITTLQATIPYDEGFEGIVGNEWSHTSTIYHAGAGRTLGAFGNQTVNLTLPTVTGRMYRVVFILNAIDSWDGTTPGLGPDTFEVLINGTRIEGGEIGQTAATTTIPFTLHARGNWYGRTTADSRFRFFAYFTAPSSSTTISFVGRGLQDISDESWALDWVNVGLATMPSVPFSQTFEANVFPFVGPARTKLDAPHSFVIDNLGATTQSLVLRTTPSTDYILIFDLWAFDSWDAGTDVFEVWNGQSRLFGGSITGITNRIGTFPAIPQQHLTPVGGFANVTTGGRTWGDKLFRRISVPFTATENRTVLNFYVPSLSGGSDESWGLDNISVVTAASAPVLPAFRGRAQSAGLHLETAFGVPSSALWIDMNGDGLLESIQAGDSALTVLYNTAPNTYTGPAVPAALLPLTVIDCNNDGTPEIWHRRSTGVTDALSFRGVGTSAVAVSEIGSNTGAFSFASGLRAVVPVDANADGWIDLALLGTGSHSLAINRGVDEDGRAREFGSAALPNSGLDVGGGARAATGDLNNDTIPDIYWSNGAGRLWLSDGAGGYSTHDFGISVFNSTTQPAGAVFADFDNDSDLDLFVGRRGNALTPTLWVNQGGTFVEQSASRGLGSLVNVTEGVFGDYDNDGDLDLLYSSASGFSGIARNGGSASAYSFTLFDDGTVTETRGGDSVLADVDGDGDLDYSFTSESTDVPSRHWLNTLNNGNQSLTVRVIGKGAGYINTAAIGTRVELWDATNTQFLQRRDVGLAKGAGGMTPLWVHFGGVDENTTYTLRVWGRGTIYSVPVTPAAASTTFTSGTRQRFYTFDENVHAPRVRVVQFREAMQGE
jgi:hypothetical protein